MPQVAAQLHERARRTADCANSDTAENSVHAVFDTFATHQKHIFDSEQRKYSILLPLALFARIVGPHAPRDVHIPAVVTDVSQRGRARCGLAYRVTTGLQSHRPPLNRSTQAIKHCAMRYPAEPRTPTEVGVRIHGTPRRPCWRDNVTVHTRKSASSPHGPGSFSPPHFARPKSISKIVRSSVASVGRL